jgi:hypothetical protein
MRITRIARYLCLYSSLLLAPAVASAGPITYNFTGTNLEGTFTLDDAVAWAISPSSIGESGVLKSPSFQISGTYKGYNFFGVPELQVMNVTNPDVLVQEHWIVRAKNLTSNVVGGVTMTALNLFIYTGITSISTDVPRIPTQANNFSYTAVLSNGSFTSGSLTTLAQQPASVPEPASFGLLALGMAAAAAYRRRNRAA